MLRMLLRQGHHDDPPLGTADMELMEAIDTTAPTEGDKMNSENLANG